MIKRKGNEKMRILKKINKGAILTIIVLVALVIYLVGVENQWKEDKQIIKQKCEEIVGVIDECMVYPENMQKLGEEISKEDQAKYEEQVKEKLAEKMIDNEEAVEIQSKILISNLNYQNDENEIRTKYKRNIDKITGYQFEGDQVTVTFLSTVQVEKKYKDGLTGEEQTSSQNFSTSNDEIVLQKIDGNWKIVYTNLQYNEYGNSAIDSNSVVMY